MSTNNAERETIDLFQFIRRMNNENVNRQRVITEWFFQDWIGETISLPEPEDIFIFLKVLMDISSSMLGELTDQERKYILGKGAVFGRDDFGINLF